MIRATELSGRAVVDMDAAEKLGRIEKVILDPEARQVAGFEISRSHSPRGSDAHTTLPASTIHAIGPDAVTVHHSEDTADAPERFAELPRLSDVIGRKVISREGRLLGVVDDVLISGPDGRIVGYHLAESGFGATIDRLFGDRKRERGAYLRADADLRAGRELIVAPDDAVSSLESGVQEDTETHRPAVVPDDRTDAAPAGGRGAASFRGGVSEPAVDPTRP